MIHGRCWRQMHHRRSKKSWPENMCSNSRFRLYTGHMKSTERCCSVRGPLHSMSNSWRVIFICCLFCIKLHWGMSAPLYRWHVLWTKSFPWHYDIQYFTFMKHNLNADVMNVMKIHEAVVLWNLNRVILRCGWCGSSRRQFDDVWRRQFLHPSAAARWRFWWMAAVQKKLFASEIRLGPLVQDDGMGWDAEPDLIDLIWSDRLRELHGLWLTMRHEKVNEL